MIRPPARGVLLDTCALIWLMEGGLDEAIVEAMERAARADGVLVSTVSAWEIGLLHRKAARHSEQPRFAPDPRAWFARALAAPGIRLAPLTPEIALDSSALPGVLHPDPADRMLISTARERGVPLVTRDGPILTYAKAGHVDVLAC